MPKPNKRRPYDDIAALLVPRVRPSVPMTGGSTPGGTESETKANAWSNPMTDEGDLIQGLEGGAADALPVGTEDQVLTVVDVSGTLRPRWADPSSSGGGPVTSTLRYRFPIYSSYGGGDLIWDTAGHLMYALLELETVP
jgi:hypothetical protein